MRGEGRGGATAYRYTLEPRINLTYILGALGCNKVQGLDVELARGLEVEGRVLAFGSFRGVLQSLHTA